MRRRGAVDARDRARAAPERRGAARQEPAAAGDAQARRALQRLELHLPTRTTTRDIDEAVAAYGAAFERLADGAARRRRGACSRARPSARSSGRCDEPPRPRERSRSPAGRSAAARPCYVIAEAGANHNRDLGIARELIDVAADAGADAVKFQVYSGKALYSSKTPRFDYLEDVSDKDTQELLDDDRAAARVAARARRALRARAASRSSRRRSTPTPSTSSPPSACRRSRSPPSSSSTSS